jgi:uncharacterized membrane protein
MRKSLRESDKFRHILKTISWRVVGTIDTMVVSYIITGSIKVGLAIGGFEVFTKMILYYFHERIWFKYVRIGREKTNSQDSSNTDFTNSEEIYISPTSSAVSPTNESKF